MRASLGDAVPWVLSRKWNIAIVCRFAILVSLSSLSSALAQDPIWTKKCPGTSPSARYFSAMAMAYDAARQQVVFFGGTPDGLNVLGETWTWDGTNWTQKFPTTSAPARSAHVMVYDAARQQVVLFGGSSPSGLLNDTWVWDGTNWTQKLPATSPAPRQLAGMAYDAARQQVVLFGGGTVGGSPPLSDTWTWDGTNWSEKLPATVPAPRSNHALVYDGARGETVLFAGWNGIGFFSDTWTWDGINWTQKADTPFVRIVYGVAYDEHHAEVIMFGGSTAPLSVPQENDIWSWNGAAWSKKSPLASPPARAQHGMAYDAGRQQAVIFGGISGTSIVGDTWVWGDPSSNPLPIITAISLNSATQGETITDFTVTGANFQPTSSLSFDPSAGITVVPSAPTTCTQIVASIMIASDATTGNRNLVITNPDGNQATRSFQVASGTGTINVTTNSPLATFSIVGPISFSGSGTSFTKELAPAGSYTITYGAIAGLNTPPAESRALDIGGSVSFSGLYASATGSGSILVTSNLSDATYRIEGPLAFAGIGTTFVSSRMPPGQYKITYGRVSGFRKPLDQVLELNAGETISFVGNYTRLLLVFFPGLDTKKGDQEGLEILLSSATTSISNSTGNLFEWGSLEDGPGSPLEFIRANLMSSEDRVALVGHSYGGNRARLFSKLLRKNIGLTPDVAILIDAIDPEVCLPDLLKVSLECLLVPLGNPCDQSLSKYDLPAPVVQVQNYVQRKARFPSNCVQGYNLIGISSTVVPDENHATIDNNVEKVHKPVLEIFQDLSGNPKSPKLLIQNVKVSNINATTATISWRTNIGVSSLVALGRNTAYDRAFFDSTRKQDHSIVLTGLIPSATYHYSVISTISGDGKNTSGDAALLTAP